MFLRKYISLYLYAWPFSLQSTRINLTLHFLCLFCLPITTLTHKLLSDLSHILFIYLFFFCAVNTNSFCCEPASVPELWGVGGHRGDWRPGSRIKGRGEGSLSMGLVGWSGAAPPVIIRVTAARARLCAACTRRDVLPREKSEHLSVPPCRQQPPTSLSNSTQLVTRSPNSYFLSLIHARTLNSSALLFLFARSPPLQMAPLIRSL